MTRCVSTMLETRPATTGSSPVPSVRVANPGPGARPAAVPRPDTSVAVIGLGYVGLPLAIAFAEAGLEVRGVDRSSRRVLELLDARSPIDDIDDTRLRAALDRGLNVCLERDPALEDVDAVFVCVPTPVTMTRDPDLGPVLDAAAMIRDHLRPGQLVVLQSTTFPGTTRGPFRAALEASGLLAGRDFDLAFAPERVNPGDPESAGRTVPRLVGGTTPEATARAARLLRHVNDDVVELSSPDVAEMAKIVENTFRNVNIAFVNELALLCERMGIDVWQVLDAAGTKPFGFMRFLPGPGVGGHCIPVDPFYLSWKAREYGFSERFIELAGDVNSSMPRHVVGLVADALNDRGLAVRGARVGILGVAFKPDVRDARNSPAAEVIALLTGSGADVRFHDPYVAAFTDASGVDRLGSGLDDLLGWADAVVIVTPHRAIEWDAVYARADLVIDTVGHSRHRATAPRQVLRLGAGWVS